MKIDFNELELFSAGIYEKMCGYRAHLHAHPELSYQEYHTSEFVKNTLNQIGDMDIRIVGVTGIVATIYGDHHQIMDTCIAFRADLDALPIQEENDVSYKSKNDGIMHACGHDVHTSILLGLAEVLCHFKNYLPQPVKLIFQPGEEENPGGANLIIDGGGLSNPEVSKMFALHVFPDFEFGKVGFREGLYMASSDELHIEIVGKGGHGALVGTTVNPILMGAELMLRAKKYIYSETPKSVPSVINFGRFEAMGSTNVVPEKTHIKGTFRTMDEAWRQRAKDGLRAIADQIEHEFGGSIDLGISKGYPFLKNDVSLTRHVKNIAHDIFEASSVRDLDLRMTAEDFAFYSHLVPVCFFRLGVGNQDKGVVYNVHHPRFDVEPKCMSTGLLLFSSIAFSF